MLGEKKVQAFMRASVQTFATKTGRKGSQGYMPACLHAYTPTRRKAQAVLLATLVMFVVAAVGAGFILFVQSSMNLSQRSREEQEALLLAQAGLAFADQKLTEEGADWRPSITVDFDQFEMSYGWHRPDTDNDWYGKYAARQVVDLLGNVAGSGAFLIKVKYLPDEQVFKIISIGRPRPNSPVYRRLIGYKPLPTTDWIWVTAENEDAPDSLLLDVNNDNLPETLLGQAVNWQGGWWTPTNTNQPLPFWVNAERDPLQPVSLPQSEPERLWWLRLRTWLGAIRAPIWNRTTNFVSAIRVNSDLLWYGTNSLVMTDFFAATQTILEVARTIDHYSPQTQVLVYDWLDRFQGYASPSNSGTPAGSGFVFFPIGGIPRYIDGWERIGGLLPIRWVFNFSRRVEPRPAPTINLSTYYAQTRDADPPASSYGYYRLPDPLQGQAPILDNTPTSPTFAFHVLDYFDPNNPTAPNRFLAFRGIYIDNNEDKQFVSPRDAPDVDDDDTPDPQVFVDNAGDYRPELAQTYDWVVKPLLLSPRRQKAESGWFPLPGIDKDNDGLVDEDILDNADNDNDGRVDEDPLEERNTLEVSSPTNVRVAAPHFYIPPGLEVRFDVVTTNHPQIILQRTWLIRHDGQHFRSPDGTPLPDDPSTPNVNEGARLVFIDPIPLAQFDADNDGRLNEDPINLRDDDGDSKVDEDPFQTDFVNSQMPTIIILAEGNIRVSGQVAVSVKIVTPETIYIEGPLHPVTANATIELLAKRNICINFAAARTPIPPDGLNPVADRATLLPCWRVLSVAGNAQALQGIHYMLPNTYHAYLRQFSDWLSGGITGLVFPVPQDTNGDRLVDSVDATNNPLTTQVTFALTGSNLPLSQDLTANFSQLLSGAWTLRLVLLHRGMAAVQDQNGNWQPTRNPWTNLQVEVWFDENRNGQLDIGEPRFRLYGPAEPMRTFPVASRWYQGDGRQVDPNDPTTGKEWGILDLPIPFNAPGLLVDRDNDGQVTTVDLWMSMQLMRITVTSPVAGEVIPQGRVSVSYELAGIKLALYDEHGIPRPIWQISPDPRSPSPFFVFAQTVYAENGTIGIVPPPYFDPTVHPSWQQFMVSSDPNSQTRFRQWQRLWSFYYLRYNSVRWTLFLDPSDPNLTIPMAFKTQMFAQSVPIIAGQLIMRVTPQTMLWRLAQQAAFGDPNDPNDPRPNLLCYAWELSLDKASLPYIKLLTRDTVTRQQQPLRLADLQNLSPDAPLFEAPHAMFASPWLWIWRLAAPRGVLDVAGVLPANIRYRSPVVPNLSLPKGYAIVLQQQVGAD